MLPNNRNMINYYPDFIQSYFKNMINAEQPEFELSWHNTDEFLKNAFLLTAGDIGLKRFEKILKITPRASDNLDDRRFAIQAVLTKSQIVTMRTLKERLITLCGQNGYRIELNTNAYTLSIKIELGVKSQFESVKDVVMSLCPANLLIYVDLLYNSHLTLNKYTHEQMMAYTHEQLKEEVIS